MSKTEIPDNWLEFDRYAVYGLGRSGRAVCRLLADRGKRVIGSDIRRSADFDGELDNLPDAVEVVLGENAPADADMAVVSPGLEPRLDVFDELRERGIPYASEIDIAFDASDAPVVALTGTDGKTTTTALLGAMASASERPSAVGGNIGTPLSEVVSDVPPDGLVVAEVSAFQLWSCHHLRPAVVGFTNVAGDHVDYFDDWEAYVRAKRRLERNARGDDWVVYNMDDREVASWSGDCDARCAHYGFGLRGSTHLQVTPVDGTVVARGRSDREEACWELEELVLPGRHNISNAMCATAMAKAFGLSTAAIREGVREFDALPHRLERLESVGSVAFVNDSKATNVNAALAGLSTLDRPYVAIVGGVDKGLDLEPLCAELAECAAGVVVIGEIADRLDEVLQQAADPPQTARAATLEDAVERAWDWVRGREATVVLSPACSSFDMFDSYEDRGEVFRRVVERLRSGVVQ